jgi:hypothetical protein
MKRVLLTVAVALLIPSILMAAPVTVGVYFDGSILYTPTGAPGDPIKAALYVVQSEYYITGVEYALATPDGNFFITGYTYPPNHALALGDAVNGHSITYWPPLTGYPLGYDLLVTYECRFLATCGSVVNYPIHVVANPDSGYLRGTYSPNNDFFDIIGLTSYLCPDQEEPPVGTEEKSWGTIKSMYR